MIIPNKKLHSNDYHIQIDGRTLRNSVAIMKSFEWGDYYHYYSENYEDSLDLSSKAISDYQNPYLISLKHLVVIESFIIAVNIFHISDEIKYLISFNFEADFSSWKNAFSFEEFEKKLALDWSEDDFDNCEYEKYQSPHSIGFEIKFETEEINKKIEEIIKPYQNTIEHSIQKTIQSMNETYSGNSLEYVFKFPEEVKTYCEQYLKYFAQFLQDLGMNATSSLKDDAGKVLFSVTPANDIEALNKIREALVVYLNLPSSPIVYDESFKAMRLEQQIDNLHHSQKMAAREIQLAQRVIESQDKIISEKDNTIFQKDSVINQQNKIIEKITSKSIMVDSLENKEELFEGVEVIPSETIKKHLGIILNPITALKGIGKKFLGKEDDIISILGSDEETNQENN